jgi:hypothetical protein
MALNVAWYVENKSLKTRGIDVINLMKKRCHLHKSKKRLGPKNGYRYDRKFITNIEKNIFELYTKVMRKSKVINGHIDKKIA